jgi:hypothetical protein
MGDDIGWMQPGIYHKGLIRSAKRRTSIGSAKKAQCSRPTTPSRAARRDATPSSPACTRSHRHDPAPAAGQPVLPAARHAGARQGSCATSATTPASSARTISATTPTRLPTAHGFQEFWGYLYHLDAMQGVSFPDINKTPTEQTIAPPCINTPIPGSHDPAAVDPKDDLVPDASAAGAGLQIVRRHRRQPDLLGRGAADAGALEDRGRGDLEPRSSTSSIATIRRRPKAVLRLVQPRPHAHHHRASGQVRSIWLASPAARTGASTKPA